MKTGCSLGLKRSCEVAMGKKGMSETREIHLIKKVHVIASSSLPRRVPFPLLPWRPCAKVSRQAGRQGIVRQCLHIQRMITGAFQLLPIACEHLSSRGLPATSQCIRGSTSACSVVARARAATAPQRHARGYCRHTRRRRKQAGLARCEAQQASVEPGQLSSSERT